MHPILFKIGSVTIYAYGVMVAVAFLVATFLLSRQFKKNGLEQDLAVDLAIYVLVCGIIGARLLYVFLNAGYYVHNFREIFMLHHGGLAWQGGFIFAFGGALFFMKRNNLKIGATCDMVIPYVALGQSIGRIGCYLNGCCFGVPTDCPLGVVFPSVSQPVHPTQLYTSFFLIVIFLIIKGAERRKSFDWQIFFLYLIFYAVMRFSLDFFRGDLQSVFFGLTTSQLISLIFFLTGLSFYFVKTRFEKRKYSLR